MVFLCYCAITPYFHRSFRWAYSPCPVNGWHFTSLNRGISVCFTRWRINEVEEFGIAYHTPLRSPFVRLTYLRWHRAAGIRNRARRTGERCRGSVREPVHDKRNPRSRYA